MPPSNDPACTQAMNAILGLFEAINGGDAYYNVVRRVTRRAVDITELDSRGELPAMILQTVDYQHREGPKNGQVTVLMEIEAVLALRVKTDDPSLEVERLLADFEKVVSSNVQPVADTNPVHELYMRGAQPWMYGGSSGYAGAYVQLFAQYSFPDGDPSTISS